MFLGRNIVDIGKELEKTTDGSRKVNSSGVCFASKIRLFTLSFVT